MSLNEEERKAYNDKGNFYKWGFIVATILLICFSLGFCHAIYTKDTEGKGHFNKPWKNPNEIYNQWKPSNNESFKEDGEKSQDLITNEKKRDMIEPYKSQLPSNMYQITKPTTIHQLANKWHIGYVEIYQLNPWLKDYEPSDIIKPPVTPGAPSESTKPSEDNKIINVPTGSKMSEFEQKVLALTNQYRKDNGVTPLLSGSNESLNKSAKAKSQDMGDNNYFDHTSKRYGDPFSMMKQFGISYNYAGENIARGQATPEDVVKDWINSPGHRANLISPNFNQMGVGYYVAKDGTPYWTQQFIGK